MPDHVITRVMMAELEKRQEQHWLLDGESRGEIPAPLGTFLCSQWFGSPRREKSQEVLRLEVGGEAGTSSRCPRHVRVQLSPWHVAGKGKGRERSRVFHEAQQGWGHAKKNLLLPLCMCEAAPPSQPKNHLSWRGRGC